MKCDFEQKKTDIILVISIMTMLFTLCIVLYSGTFDRDHPIEITTNLNFQDENEALSKELQEKIPFTEVTDKTYITAYQSKKTTIKNINNAVLLTIALQKLNKTNVSSTELLRVINANYGDTIFLINESFNVNNIDDCTYQKSTNEYTCIRQNRNGLLYQVRRKIKSIRLNDDKAILTEENIFYTTEKKNDIIYYKVFEDETYNKIIGEFTSIEVTQEQKTIATFLEKYITNGIIYESTFKKIGDEYKWISTEKK